jgi:hypothetical protein
MVRDSPPHTHSRTADCSQRLRDNFSQSEVKPLAHWPMAIHHDGIKLGAPHSGEPAHGQLNPRIQQQKIRPLAILRGQLKSKGMGIAWPLPPAVPVSTPGAGPSTEQLPTCQEWKLTHIQRGRKHVPEAL